MFKLVVTIGFSAGKGICALIDDITKHFAYRGRRRQGNRRPFP